MFASIKNFFADVRSEFSRVTWPTADETRQHTAVVLTVTFALSLMLGLVDIGLSALVKTIVK